MPADEQSVLPGMPGVPWWGAILIAAGITAVGATIDALTNSSLGLLYNVFYLIGCVAAVLAVRRRALFTAAVQPPLVTLIIGLISLYGLTLANGDAGKPQGMRSAVLNIALPFSNLFPWIFGTFVITLLIAAVRWFVTRGGADPIRIGSRTLGGSRPRGATKARRTTGTGKTGTAKAGASAGAARKAGTAKSGARKSKSGSTKSGSAKSGTTKSGSAKSSARKPGSAKPGSAKSAPAAAAQRRAAESDSPKAARSPKGSKAGGSKSGAPRPERPRAAAAEKRPRPAPARPADETTVRATPERAGSPRGEARPVRRSQSPVSQGRDRPVRRAQPQVIPPRPRPTAGEQLRGHGTVEDLAGGLDD